MDQLAIPETPVAFRTMMTELGALKGNLSLSLAEFKQLAQTHRVIPIARKLLADESTPVALYSKLTNSKSGSFLLESAEHDKSWSRWSFIGVNSPAYLTVDDTGAHWNGKVPVGLVDHHDPITALRIAMDALKTPIFAGMPPLTGGLVGAINYSFVSRIESAAKSSMHLSKYPQAILLLTTDMAAIDHHSGEIWLIANAVNFDNSAERVEQAYQDCQDRLDDMQGKLTKAADLTPLKFTTDHIDVVNVESDEEFEVSVNKAKEYIYAGDAFQVVLSRQFHITTDVDSFLVYRVLRATNPSPYMYHLVLPHNGSEIQLVGASPEALVKVKGHSCLLHPIAGTRPRGKTTQQDIELEQDLLADLKERAEHLMLVDLGRNDLGKVAQPGSVEVSEFMKVERYSHVMHIVSTITANLATNKDGIDVLAATFPAGTLSGAPKPRAMQIIDQLESCARDFYAGCVGYFDFAGNLDMAITIRTAVMDGGKVIVQAGAGIVADSDPTAENEECKNKARAVIKAIALAQESESL